MVYVLSKDGKPLMPTNRHGKVRRWLRDGKAKVVKRIPFTIQLLFETGNKAQSLTLGIDPGSKEAGFAVRQTSTKKIVYSSIVKLRDDIKSKLEKRRKYRRNRRNRKTRYRKPRFLNRKRKEGWLPPSVESKINSTIKELNYILSILPIARICYEYSKFDIHKISKPWIKGFWYQKGDMYGFESTKQYVLARDNYRCQYNKKHKNVPLQVHHVKFRRNGGTDKPSNLITLCQSCHDNFHEGKINLTKNHLKKCINTIDATQVSIVSKRIREYLLELKRDYDFRIVKTYGYITKVKRRLLKLKKDHHLDAVAITYPKKENYRKGLKKPKVQNHYRKICIPKGDYQQTKGTRSQQRLQTGKIQGFRKFDLVRYLGKVYAIKGRMSTGYAILMNSNEKKVNLKPIPKFSNLIRLQARTLWIIFPEITENI